MTLAPLITTCVLGTSAGLIPGGTGLAEPFGALAILLTTSLSSTRMRDTAAEGTRKRARGARRDA